MIKQISCRCWNVLIAHIETNRRFWKRQKSWKDHWLSYLFSHDWILFTLLSFIRFFVFHVQMLRRLLWFWKLPGDEFYSLSVIKNAFSNNRHFSRPRCEQMETDLKNPPHGFFSERTHLVVLARVFPKSDGF